MVHALVQWSHVSSGCPTQGYVVLQTCEHAPRALRPDNLDALGQTQFWTAASQRCSSVMISHGLSIGFDVIFALFLAHLTLRGMLRCVQYAMVADRDWRLGG